MKKKVGVIMIVFVIAIVVIIGIILFFQRKGKGNTNIEFSKEVAPYTKTEEESFRFEAVEELNISSISSNLVLKQEDCSEICVKLLKKVGDTSEEHLEEELAHIICKMADSTLEIGMEKGYQSAVNSKYMKAELTIPEKVKSLNIVSQTGDVEVDGSYDKIAIDSNTGDIKLNISELDTEDNILLNGKIGNVNIKLPKQSKIKLCGSQQNNVKLGDGILQDEDGTVIEVNKSTSRIKIVS